MNEIIVRPNTIQPQGQTQIDECVRTNQTSDLQSCNGSPDGTRREDGDWEDSLFIEEGGWVPNTQTTRDKPIQRRRKKRKGKSHY